jgi:hypothetical protein
MNVPDQFLEVRVLIADNGLITVCEQVAVPLVPPVEGHCVARKKPPHECGQAYRTTSHQEVDMVWKQGPRINARPREPGDVPESYDERLSILVIPKNETLLYTADDDVMQGTWGIQPRTTRHEEASFPFVRTDCD